MFLIDFVFEYVLYVFSVMVVLKFWLIFVLVMFFKCRRFIFCLCFIGILVSRFILLVSNDYKN